MTDTIQVQVPSPISTAPWGFHAIIDCTDVDELKIKDSNNIKNWVADVLTKLDASASGSVTLTNSGMVGKTGYSAFQLFNSGSLTAHFAEDAGQIYIDVFSWKMYDPSLLEESVKSFFGNTTDTKKILIPRNASVPAAPATV